MKQKSLRQLAKELGVSHSYLSQVRNGKRPASAKVVSKMVSNGKQNIVDTYIINSYNERKRGVAQPGSAPEWGSGGRRFKSDHPDHRFKI